MKRLKRYQWFAYFNCGGGTASEMFGEGETIEELQQAMHIVATAHIYSCLPDENEVMDLQERVWLSKEQLNELGLKPSALFE